MLSWYERNNQPYLRNDRYFERMVRKVYQKVIFMIEIIKHYYAALLINNQLNRLWNIVINWLIDLLEPVKFWRVIASLIYTMKNDYHEWF